MDLRIPIIARLKEDWKTLREREKGLNSIMNLLDNKAINEYITEEIKKNTSIKPRHNVEQNEVIDIEAEAKQQPKEESKRKRKQRKKDKVS